MKMLKTVIAAFCALAILAGAASNIYAHCGNCPGDKKEGAKECPKKCCEEAKKAGKTCEKCVKKDDKKDEAK